MLLDLSISFIKKSVKYSELISAVIGTIFFYKYKYTHIKYFLYLLWYITLTEFFGTYIVENDILTLIHVDENGNKYNTWIYNLLRFITFITLFYIYYKSIKIKKYQLWVKLFSISYITLTIINWIFIQNFISEISETPKIVGSIFLIITIIFYFIELLKSDQIVAFHKTLLFWISVGLLLFYSGTIPFTLKTNGYATIPGIHELFLIVYILAIIMYLIFTFGFIWSKKE